MIAVVQTGEVREDVRRLVHAVNFSPVVVPLGALAAADAVVTVSMGLVAFGGVAVDRSVFRRLFPDAQWALYAAGRVATSDGNLATVTLQYAKDDASTVTLGSLTHTGVTTKKTLGPFDLFGTAGVPAGETVPVVQLTAQKATAGTATLSAWDVWLILRPPRV